MNERVASPFRPGYSRAPAVLAGRDDVLAEADEGLAEIAVDRAGTRGLVLIGVRGVGKTVLLKEIAARAGERYGMPRLRVQMTDSTNLMSEIEHRTAMLHEIVAEEPPGRRLQLSEAVLSASTGPIGGELHLTRPEPTLDPLDRKLRLERALGQLAAELTRRESGLVITVDEIQLARRSDLQELGAILQLASEEDWPLLPVLAGLPSVRDARRLGTFFERAHWSTIGLLDSADTLTALTAPAASAGRPFDPDAAVYTAELSGGYPYAIQLFGKHAWRASDGSNVITLEAARRAGQLGQDELDRSLYEQRWAQTPPSEREYLVAVAQVIQTGPATGGQVARRLGKSTRSLSSYRARLLDRGTLIDDGEQLRFVIPGMAVWVLKQASDASDS